MRSSGSFIDLLELPELRAEMCIGEAEADEEERAGRELVSECTQGGLVRRIGADIVEVKLGVAIGRKDKIREIANVSMQVPDDRAFAIAPQELDLFGGRFDIPNGEVFEPCRGPVEHPIVIGGDDDPASELPDQACQLEAVVVDGDPGVVKLFAEEIKPDWAEPIVARCAGLEVIFGLADFQKAIHQACMGRLLLGRESQRGAGRAAPSNWDRADPSCRAGGPSSRHRPLRRG